MRDKVKAGGYRIATREQAQPGDVVTDDIAFNKAQGSSSVFVIGPDDIIVQFVEAKNPSTPIALHHIHFAGPATEMRDWYVKEFGAKAGTRGTTASLPGVELSFAQAADAAPTRGRVLDHVGFEVKGLEAFVKKLEADGVKIERGYTNVPALKVAVAFVYDPWGTYIELTEGLDAIQ